MDILVRGMTCEHCVRAVTEELSALPGVQSVHIDLVPGGDSPVRIDGSGVADLDEDVIADAVDEAGYTLVRG